MKNMIERILDERKKNIQKGLHKDANLGRLVLRLSNTMYGITGLRTVTKEEFDKMKEKIKDIDTENTKVIATWDSNMI